MIKTNTPFDQNTEYAKIGELPEGGNAYCYILQKEKQYYVLKVSKFRDDDKIVKEAKTLLDNNIFLAPNVYEYSSTGFNYILMDYIPGISLDRFYIPQADKSFSMSNKHIIEIFEILAAILRLSHDANIIHRDISPSNILIDQDLLPHLIDWGEEVDVILGKKGITTQNLHGTLPYIPPEGFEGKYSKQSDIYMLGACLMFALTGDFPFCDLFWDTNAIPEFQKEVQKLGLNFSQKKFQQLKDCITKTDMDGICVHLRDILSSAVPKGLKDKKYQKGTPEYQQLDSFRQSMMDLANDCMIHDQELRPTEDDFSVRIIEIVNKENAKDPNFYPGGEERIDEILSTCFDDQKRPIFGTEENIRKAICECGFGYDPQTPLGNIAANKYPEFVGDSSLKTFHAFLKTVQQF